MTIPAVNQVASTNSTTQPPAATTTTDNSQLSSQAFLQLLVAQLQYQDPSSPTDTSTLMNETATLNQIQTMQALSTATSVQTATTMVGHNVTYLDGNGNTLSGQVLAATLTGSTPMLDINGNNIALSSVQTILADSVPTGSGGTTT
jgi:flagellar basal-body rod modification protein FlgD